MDAQIRELAYGIWFGCKTSSFLREAARRLGGWALTTWLPLAGRSVLHQSCHATSRFLAEGPYLLFRMNAAFQGSFSRRHDAHLVSLIRPVTIHLSPGHKQVLSRRRQQSDSPGCQDLP